MNAQRPSQFNIRSDFAKQRAHAVAAETGMTATQVVEEALRRAFPPRDGERVGGLVRKGWMLIGSTFDGRPVTHEQTNAAIDALRNGERD